jgi:hypothetical protein
MKIFLKDSILMFFAVCLFACKKPFQPIPHYTVSKEFKSDSLTTINVHIDNRLTTNQLLLIAGKLKSDSALIKNLKICYLLPGNTEISAGDNSYYAAARYIAENQVKATDTLKDDNGNVFRIQQFGLSGEKAKHLLSLKPKEIEAKNVLGKFIDDYSHTVIIPYKDITDKEDKLYIIELDSTAKVVSATEPLKIKDVSIEKWQVTQNGDYIIIKDSILAQYPSNSFGVPFNSIKAGI